GGAPAGRTEPHGSPVQGPGGLPPFLSVSSWIRGRFAVNATADPICSADLAVPHGFFTRLGGVSGGPYASLNCSLSGQDSRDAVLENRARAARAIGANAAGLVGLTQVHG